MKKLRLLADKPIIGPFIKKAMGFAVNNEVKTVSRHFATYLSPILATTPLLKADAYHIRHSVFCEELKFEEENHAKIEKDDFDDHSLHCLIQHLPTNRYAGTVRVVRPEAKGQSIPIQKYCLNSISPGEINPCDFKPYEICEISRLAIPNEFRRRKMDKFNGASTGVINQQIHSENELRCFPLIAIGLYLSAASLVMENQIKHTFVMMEPRLARSMCFVGIKFKQIGPVYEYHGKRAPYYINPQLLMEDIRPETNLIMRNISNILRHQQTKGVIKLNSERPLWQFPWSR